MSRGDFGGGYGAIGGDDGRASFGRPSGGGYQQGGTSGDFQSLTDSVSSNVFQINSNTSSLERILKQLTAGKDDVQVMEKLHRIQQATNKLAGDSTAILKRMNSLCSGSSPAARQQRVQNERLKDEFRDAISRYYTVQNKVTEREKLFLNSSRGASARGSGFGDDYGSEKTSLLDEEQRRQEQQQLDQQIAIDEALIREREEHIRQLEGDIIDINEIFRELASMVYEQGEIIDSIESNIYVAHTNVENANVQLTKASNYQKSARKKMCILLLILLFVGGAIGLIVYLSTK